jgi:hypothetical protein
MFSYGFECCKTKKEEMGRMTCEMYYKHDEDTRDDLVIPCMYHYSGNVQSIKKNM